VNVVIVGAAAAGLATAETLRQDGFDGTVTLIGDEEHLPYDRPPLSKQVLSGAWPQERLRLREEDALAASGIDLRLGTRALAVDSGRCEVRCADGVVGYDELVIATGVRPRRLPGTDGVPGVHVLRDLADGLALRDVLAGKPRLVVVGAGFLGAEVAAVARQAGADVTLVSDLPAPLSDVLGPEVGEFLLGTHVGHGVRVLRGTRVEQVLTEDGRASGVRLADGRTVAADTVLVAIGSVPATEWLAGSGIPLGDGVVCDEFCRAAPHVWAAGDVASWWHAGLGERIRLEHRTNAAEQGRAAARNILAATPVPFTPVPYIWSDQYDLKIQIHGTPRGCDRMTVVDGSLAERTFVALYGADGVVRAAVGVNSPRALRAARAHLTTSTPWETVTGPGVPA
jgi:3-phenylpropionate/trans-cinnamate dioxygenase ferredoxin reductase subunit